MPKLTDKQISALVDKLDCAAIHRFMEQKNWTWFRAERGVPAAQEIAAEASRLLRKVRNLQDGSYIETGGLRAVNNGGGDFEIMFLAFREHHYADK